MYCLRMPIFFLLFWLFLLTNHLLAISLALTQWRQLSAFLLNPKRSDRGVLVPDESTLKPIVEEFTASLNKFLSPFVNEKALEDQQNHLQAMTLECAKFGYVIFSQPAEFMWKFSIPPAVTQGEGKEQDKEEKKEKEDEGKPKEGKGDVRKEIVICPGLEKITDEQGNRCDPETVVAPEIHEA